MKPQIILILLIGITCLTFILTPFYVSSPAKTLKPTDDNSVRSDLPTHSGGASSSLLLIFKGQALANAWIKFDLSEIPSTAEITNAKFRVYQTGIGVTRADARLRFAVCFGNTNWKQGTINWNNQPFFGEELYWWETTPMVGESSGWREWSDYRLITQIQTKLKAEKQIAFVLKIAETQVIPEGDIWNSAFSSKEASSNQPELIIDYTIPTYKLTVTVKDQVGNPLPASVTIAGKTVSCSASTGSSPPIEVGMGTIMIYTQIRVGDLTFNTSKTVTVTSDKMEEVTINRRFLWEFYINYTDGTLARGTLSASSAKETLTTPIIDGYGRAYLTDAVYTFSFEASPAVALKTVTVTNDGELYATINKATLTSETQTSEVPVTSPKSPVTTPIPWILIPSVYIYTLIGVLAFGFILAAVVALRRKPR